MFYIKSDQRKTRNEINSKMSMQCVGILLFLIFQMLPLESASQRIESSSSEGSILPQRNRPVLEARILRESESMSFYPGSHFSFSIFVKNTGSSIAKHCYVKFEASDPALVVDDISIDMFDLMPGDSIVTKVRGEVRGNASLGPIYLTMAIEEANGFDLFPLRNVVFRVEEAPEFEVIVSDVAMIDQRGIGYFEQFEDVRLFFRVQNCSQNSFSNVNAQIQLHPGVLERQLNPNFSLGTLEPGEFKDLNAVVSTGIMSENISLDIALQYDQFSYTQDFVFEFRQDYKHPDKMYEQEGCNRFLSSISSDSDSIYKLPPKSPNVERYALVIPVVNYYSLDNLDYAAADGQAFIDLLTQQLGYPRSNVFALLNLFDNELRDLDTRNDLAEIMRRWRRSRSEIKELTFYFIGYGSLDMFNGDVFLLPTNFTYNVFESRVNINDVYQKLEQWRVEYDFKSVKAFFNIHFVEQSPTGNKKANEFSFVKLQNDLPEITSFWSASHKQSSYPSQNGLITLFTEQLIQGLKGGADYNKSGRIKAIDLYRFLTDEFSGVPAQVWDAHQSFSVPMFFGNNADVY